MKIEKLTASDVEFYRVSIYELMQYDFLSTYGTQADSDFIFLRIKKIPEYMKSNRAIIFGAVEESSLLGFLWAYPVDTPFEVVLHVAYIAVKPAARKKGIGSSLLKAIELEAEQRELSHVELIVGTNNNSARKFYENSGYMEKRLYMHKRI